MQGQGVIYYIHVCVLLLYGVCHMPNYLVPLVVIHSLSQLLSLYYRIRRRVYL